MNWELRMRFVLKVWVLTISILVTFESMDVDKIILVEGGVLLYGIIRKSTGDRQAILENMVKLSEFGRELEQSSILAVKGEIRFYIFIKFLPCLIPVIPNNTYCTVLAGFNDTVVKINIFSEISHTQC